MKRNVFLATAIFILSISISHAQSWQWGRNGGGSTGSGSGDNTILDMKADKEGNMYILAIVTRTSANFMGDIVSVNGPDDFLLYKLDCDGNKIWKKQIGDMSSIDGETEQLVLDQNENVYIVGFSNPGSSHPFKIDTDTTYTPGISERIHSSIIKFDKNGNYKYYKINQIPNVIGYLFAFLNPIISEDNYLYILTNVRGNIGIISRSDTTQQQYYILKYDTNAILQSYFPITDSGTIFNWSITSDKNNIYIGGYTAAVGSDSKVTIFGGHQVSASKSFLFKFGKDGNFKWIKVNDDSAKASFLDIAYYNNSIAITGTGGAFGSRPMSYDGFNLHNSYSTGINSTFVLRVDTNGHVISGTMLGVDGNCIGYSLDIDNVGNICVGGLIAGNAAQIGSKSYSSITSIDGFIMKLSPNMNYISSDILVGSAYNQVDKVAFDEMGNVYAGGNFDVNMQLGTTDTLTKVGGGSSDLFIAKYGVPTCTCPYAVSNYTDAFTSSLTYTYTSSASNADTIWWEFGDGNTQSGGTTATHTYATAGSFTVCQHVSNVCSDDEFCKSVSVVTGINDVKESYSAIIYPNPASTSIHIHMQGGDLPENCLYVLFDMAGKQILNGKINGNDTCITLSSAVTDGVYLLQINNRDGMMLMSKRVEVVR